MAFVFLLLWASYAAASIQDTVVLPPEVGGNAPARLAFSQVDLASCWSDPTARRCILRAPIKLDESSWRQSFQSTGGVAVQGVGLPPLTITAVPCSLRGGCLSTGNSSSLFTLDLNSIAGSMLVTAGGDLIFGNVRLSNPAPTTDYQYTAAQPYRSQGDGLTLWPSIGYAPDARVVMVNTSVSYINSSAASCADYDRSFGSFQQVFGVGNVSAINTTAYRVVGPLNLTLTVYNGSNNATLGHATLTYHNVTLTCLPGTQIKHSGLSPGSLAAAIVVPVVAVLLGALLAAFWFRRRRRRSRQPLLLVPHADGSGKLLPVSTMPGNALLDADIDSDQDPSSAAVQASSGQDVIAAPVAIVVTNPTPQGPEIVTHSLLYRSSASDTLVSTASNNAGPVSTRNIPPGLQVQPGPGSSGHRQQYLPAAPVITTPEASPQLSLATPGSATPIASARGSIEAGHARVSSIQPEDVGSAGAGLNSSRQHSLNTGADSTPRSSADYRIGTADGGNSIRVAGSVVGSDRFSSVSALLKARSDVAVLRELKIGPLLGQGSYGRVYRGRWKATTVAVKIIEHHRGPQGVPSSGGQRISAGRESLLAMSISHPNVVTTYHISTMSLSERNALASSWLEENAGAGSSNRATLQTRDALDSDHDGADSSLSSAVSSEFDDFEDEDEPAPDLLETWIIMEFCERGSLERAIKLGKFGRRGRTAGEGQGGGGGEQQQTIPEMVGILKALLDTASGLDYLHSIGVVHGDVKTANVLLKGSTRDARMTCKITDFGLSRVLDMEASHISTGTYGTIVYMPKELLLTGRMTQATDIYSFGLMMWELFTGEPVMEAGLSVGQMFYMIAYQNWRPEVPPACPPGYAELMQACWHEDPEQRPTAQQLLRQLQNLYVDEKQQFSARRSGRAGTTAAAAAAIIPAAAAASAVPVPAPATSLAQSAPVAAPEKVPHVSIEAAPPEATTAAGAAAVPAQFETVAGALRPSRERELDVAQSNATSAPTTDPVTMLHGALEEAVQALLLSQQHQQDQAVPLGPDETLSRHTSTWPASSIYAGSSCPRSSLEADIGTSGTATGRPSVSSSDDKDGDYQPYAQAVIRRSLSLSVPAAQSQGRLLATGAHPGSPAAVTAGFSVFRVSEEADHEHQEQEQLQHPHHPAMLQFPVYDTLEGQATRPEGSYNTSPTRQEQQQQQQQQQQVQPGLAGEPPAVHFMPAEEVSFPATRPLVSTAAVPEGMEPESLVVSGSRLQQITTESNAEFYSSDGGDLHWPAGLECLQADAAAIQEAHSGLQVPYLASESDPETQQLVQQIQQAASVSNRRFSCTTPPPYMQLVPQADYGAAERFVEAIEWASRPEVVAAASAAAARALAETAAAAAAAAGLESASSHELHMATGLPHYIASFLPRHPNN